jgi:HK97 family phage prohead protease
MIERREASTKVVTGEGKIRGTASVTYNGEPGSEYELWEGTFERISPGAFDRHLQTQPDVVALFNHDANVILGRTPTTLQLSTDERGLHYIIDPPDTQAARDIMTSIQRGDIRGSSFAFTPQRVEWRQDGNKDIRMIHEATLHDVSVVTRPAYGSTSVGVRSEERQQLEAERDQYRATMETEKRLAKLKILQQGNT